MSPDCPHYKNNSPMFSLLPVETTSDQQFSTSNLLYSRLHYHLFSRLHYHHPLFLFPFFLQIFHLTLALSREICVSMFRTIFSLSLSSSKYMFLSFATFHIFSCSLTICGQHNSHLFGPGVFLTIHGEEEGRKGSASVKFRSYFEGVGVFTRSEPEYIKFLSH